MSSPQYKWTTVFAPRTAPHPGMCLGCGTVDRDLISFPVTQSWNGAMLLCTQCFNTAALENEVLDLTKRSEALATQEDLEKKLTIASGTALEFVRYKKELQEKANDLFKSSSDTVGNSITFSSHSPDSFELEAK